MDIEDLLKEVEEEDVGPGGAVRDAAISMLAEEVGSRGAAELVADIGALDVVEIFSPKRVTLELQRFGLRDGVAVDLDEMKPCGTARWDMDQEADFAKVRNMINEEKPLLLTSSPPCTTFSPLRRITNPKRDAPKKRGSGERGCRKL